MQQGRLALQTLPRNDGDFGRSESGRADGRLQALGINPVKVFLRCCF